MKYSVIKYLTLCSAVLYFSNMVHADDNQDIIEICENHNHYISDWVNARADNESKDTQKQKLIDDLTGVANKSSFNQGAVNQIQTTYFDILDKIYQDKPVQLFDPNYIEYVDNLEQQAQSDCVRRLQAFNQQHQQNRFKSVMVIAECGYGCFQRKLEIEKAQAPIYAIINNNSNSSSISGDDIAGSYRYTLHFRDNRMCFGNFTVNNSDKQITLHINQRDCNLNSVYRYP